MSTRSYKFWTDKEKQYLKDHNTTPIQEIADALGRTYGSIIAMRRKLGLTRPDNWKLLPSQIQLVKRFYPILGSSDSAQIADCSVASVHKIQREFDLPHIPRRYSPSLSPAELSYIAAYLDSDGSLNFSPAFHKDKMGFSGSLNVSFGGTRKSAIAWIHMRLRQLVEPYHPLLQQSIIWTVQHPLKGRLYFRTSAYRTVPLYIILAALEPYVINKAEAIQAAIEFLQTHAWGQLYTQKDYKLIYTVRINTLHYGEQGRQTNQQIAYLAGLTDKPGFKETNTESTTSS